MVKPDLEHFIQLGSENVQGQSQYTSRQCISVLDCPCEKSFSSYPAQTSLVSIYACCPSSCPNEPPWRVQPCPHGLLPASSTSPTLLMGQLLQPGHLGVFLLIFLQRVDVFPVVGGPNWTWCVAALPAYSAEVLSAQSIPRLILF